MWARNNKGNVFVGNLPPDFPDERLAEAFDPFGIVLTAAVARDPSTGARLRYGFVDIATEKAATQAIAALDGSQIDGCKLNVKPREAAKKAPAGRPRRAPPRADASNGSSYPAAPVRRMAVAAEMEPVAREISAEQRQPVQSQSAQSQSAQSQSAQSQSAQSQSAQSQRALEGLPEFEPPPRRDFEVVRRPIRRGTPSFQVERRPLPRRV